MLKSQKIMVVLRIASAVTQGTPSTENLKKLKVIQELQKFGVPPQIDLQAAQMSAKKLCGCVYLSFSGAGPQEREEASKAGVGVSPFKLVD